MGILIPLPNINTFTMPSFNFRARLKALEKEARNDVNLNRFYSLVGKAVSRAPRAGKTYLSSKVPIVQWIGHYSPYWLGNDLLAGTHES